MNDNLIEGTKTRITTSTTVDQVVTGLSTTHVTGGKITFSDGTVTTWSSDKKRTSTITLDSNNRPASGTITTEGETLVTNADNTILYSHSITKALTEDISCGRDHHGPVSGTVETHYKSDAISIDFGDGTCANKTISVTVNGVTTTKTIGE